MIMAHLLIQMIVIQILAQATNGLGIILENRYYGESNPFPDQSTDHLAYLTTEQSLSPELPCIKISLTQLQPLPILHTSRKTHQLLKVLMQI